MADSVSPKWPSCEGRQYAPDIDAGHYVGMGYDESGNEIPSDTMMMHEEATPGKGSMNYSGGQYANEFGGGYGVSVGTPEPSREKTTVDTQKTHQASE